VEESAEDLAASTLLHKDGDLNDPDKLLLVLHDLERLRGWYSAASYTIQ
jgi:hypothetical protein